MPEQFDVDEATLRDVLVEECRRLLTTYGTQVSVDLPQGVEPRTITIKISGPAADPPTLFPVHKLTI